LQEKVFLILQKIRDLSTFDKCMKNFKENYYVDCLMIAVMYWCWGCNTGKMSLSVMMWAPVKENEFSLRGHFAFYDIFIGFSSSLWTAESVNSCANGHGTCFLHLIIFLSKRFQTSVYINLAFFS
jgi:hypothetical protein